MGEKWAPKIGAHYFFFKKMGDPKIKKRWAKDGLRKIQNRISYKSKRKCVKEQKFLMSVANGRPNIKKKMGGRWAICQNVPTK